MRALLAELLFGFVFINSRLDATRRIFTLGSTYQFRIYLEFVLFGHTLDYCMCLLKL